MQVEELMSKQVYCCSPDDSLAQAAQLMWDRDCGCLPVCNHSDGGHHALGAITDRDICMCALFQGKPLGELRVSEAMARSLQACQAGDSVEQAGSLMRSAKVRRLPVLDAQGQLQGVISLADLARWARQGLPHSEVGETLAALCTR